MVGDLDLFGRGRAVGGILAKQRVTQSLLKLDRKQGRASYRGAWLSRAGITDTVHLKHALRWPSNANWSWRVLTQTYAMSRRCKVKAILLRLL